MTCYLGCLPSAYQIKHHYRTYKFMFTKKIIKAKHPLNKAVKDQCSCSNTRNTFNITADS